MGDGELILLAAGDGSNNVAVIKQGQQSRMIGNIVLSFGNTQGKHDASDIDFVRHNDKLFAIFSSVLHNHVMIADLTPFTKDVEQQITIDNGVDILLHEGDESSAKWDPRGINTRRIRVIPDSKYFWVDAPELDTVYVVEMNFQNIGKSKIVTEISELSSKDIVYVPPPNETASTMSTINTSKNLGIFSAVLSSVAILAAVVALIKGKSAGPARIQNAKKNEKDPEDPSVDLPSAL